jgi:hypothetical protein
MTMMNDRIKLDPLVNNLVRYYSKLAIGASVVLTLPPKKENGSEGASSKPLYLN